MRRALAGLALGFVVACTGATGRADELKLKDGASYEGKVIEEGESTVTFEITTGLVTGRVRFDRSRIASLARKETARDRATRTAAERRAELEKRAPDAPGLAQAWFDLSRFCKGEGLGEEKVACLQRVLALAPEHEFARAELGYVRAGDRWLTTEEAARREEEAMRAKGYAKVNGEWLSREALDGLIALEKAKAAARSQETEKKVAEMEDRIARVLEAQERATRELSLSLQALGGRLQGLDGRVCSLERAASLPGLLLTTLQADLLAARRELSDLRVRVTSLETRH
ncbi:MAG: hypothetical protein HYZ53_14405 [Planctomycetes bacterium]|nr:hypothetical protein [Planctomycetota bacterium]